MKSKKKNNQSSNSDIKDCYENNDDDEQVTSFYESAYREEELEEYCDQEPILLLTTCSDDSDYVPTMTLTLKDKERGAKSNNSMTINQSQNQWGKSMLPLETDMYDNDDREEDEALVETVAMNFGMSVSKNGCYCCCCCSRQLCSCRKINICFYNDQFHQDEIDIDMTTKASNEKLLSVAFISFLTFTCCQAIAAYLAKSEAMMGDSAAMAVDAFTYAFNLIAERVKNKNVSVQHESQPVSSSSSMSSLPSLSTESNDTIEIDEGHNNLNMDISRTVLAPGSTDAKRNIFDRNQSLPRDTQRNNLRSKRKLNLLLELIPPFISVTALVIATVIILKKAIETLILDSHRSVNEQATPNLILMLVFSCVNLVVDIINVCCFAKARHALGYSTDVAATGRNYGVSHQEVDWIQRRSINHRRQESDIHQHQVFAQAKEMKMRNKLKKNAIHIAKEKLSRTISKDLRTRRSRRKDGAQYLHLATESGSGEECKFVHHDDDNDDSGSSTDGQSQHSEYNKCCTKGERKMDGGSPNRRQNLDYRYDTMDEKIKAMITDEEDEDKIKILQRQLHLERKHKKNCIDPKIDKLVTESRKHEPPSENECQFNDNPLQKLTNSEEDIENGIVTHNEGHRDEEANLNMCSAYTHVFADTLRSIAVLVAAILAEVVDGVTSEVADAAAAVAVSIIILLALLPLLVGIKKTWYEFLVIRAEERNEL